MTVMLGELNRMGSADFAASIGDTFELAPWVAEAAAATPPFTTLTALHQAMMPALRAASLVVPLPARRRRAPRAVWSFQLHNTPILLKRPSRMPLSPPIGRVLPTVHCSLAALKCALPWATTFSAGVARAAIRLF